MGRKNDETLDLVREALDQLKRGDTVDAITTLERTAYPKFYSPSAARRAYESTLFPANDNQEAAPEGAVG
ncbi:hypothetical protein N8A98_07030 [Devosia neptuniae]|uniref:Uncharacterized protein n=1 Tax=Devosia neptuniae TaxID=191302 RepID=A0ABY6CFC0_9HYPH|nr:hypothetical protein [Devosia neptuniae]UXN70935.1 hypothetical protein N8A98_07030 [Devosia neptuniae]